MKSGAARAAGFTVFEVRRITGPTLEIDRPGAIAELDFDDDGGDPAATLAALEAEVVALTAALAWPTPTIAARRFRREAGGAGATFAFSAPIDGVDAAVDLLDAALARIRASLAEPPLKAPPDPIPDLRAAAEREAQPALLALLAEAEARGLPALIDDDALTIGHGRRGRTWPRGQLPPSAAIPWAELASIPIALVTGTNGKTTTARVLAHIAAAAGFRAGNTSTDGIAVDGVIVEEGDWTGPAATRLLLRRPELELAVLEVARGGILRRGLAITRADVAVITNVAADHLGEYGIADEAAMAAVKAVVARVVPARGRVILGADSPALWALAGADPAAAGIAAPIVWFALSGDLEHLRRHREGGGEAWFTRGGAIVRARGADEVAIVAIAAIPFTLGGAARYNVQNALAAAAAAAALGIDDAAIGRGLATFTSSAAQNPGRINRFAVGEVELVLDFAHNVAGISALAEVIDALRGRLPAASRLAVAIGMAGDRSDDDLAAIAAAVVDLGPDRVIVRELHGYLRGRAAGEVPRILAAALACAGLDPAAVEVGEDEAQSLARALAWARAGDLIVVLAHTEHQPVLAFLQERGARAL